MTTHPKTPYDALLAKGGQTGSILIIDACRLQTAAYRKGVADQQPMIDALVKALEETLSDMETGMIANPSIQGQRCLERNIKRIRTALALAKKGGAS